MATYRYRIIQLMITVGVWWVVSLASGQSETTSCRGLPEGRLVVGEQARVLLSGGLGLYAEPSISADRLTTLEANTLVLVIDGVTCDSQFTWWQVAYQGLVGWITENDDDTYRIEPFTPTQTKVVFGGIEFTLDSRIALEAFGLVFPAFNPQTASADTPFWLETPPFVSFTLNGVYDNPGVLSSFGIYPALEFGRLQRTTAIDELWSLLNSSTDPILPVSLPISTSERVLFAQPKYLTFGGGKGVRFLAYYSQALDPLTSASVSYVYQGLTMAGEYYIQIVLPIATLAFPAVIPSDFDYGEFAERFDLYISQMTQTLNQTPETEFAPSLSVMDALVASLKIDSAGLSATLAGDVTLTARCEVIAFADTRLRVAPSVESAISDYLPRNQPVAADAQFMRRGEQFPWWRLAPTAVVLPLPGILSVEGERWIRADFTSEKGNCAGLPKIEQP